MELENFLERDIVEFLDLAALDHEKKEDPNIVREEEIDVFDLTKDYSKEVDTALDSDNVAAAKKVFFDLKKQFETFSEQSQDKKRAYGIMLEISQKINDYVNSKEKKTEVIVPPEKSEAKEKKEVTAPQENKKQITREDILFRLEKVKMFLEKRQIREALYEYSEVKKMFVEVDVPKQTKDELLSEMMSVYKNLRRLEEYVVNRKQTPKPLEPVIKKAEKPSLEEELNNAKIKAYKYLDHGEPKSALIQYNKLKQLFPQVKEEDAKDRLKKEIVDLYDRIVRAKRESVVDVTGHAKIEVHHKNYAEDINEIQKLIASNQLNHANKKFLDLQHKVVKIGDEKQRRQLFQAMGMIKTKIHLATVSNKMQRVNA